MRHFRFTRVIEKEDIGYVSLCPELDIAGQGNSVVEARRNLIEAVEGFLETAGRQEISERLSSILRQSQLRRELFESD